MDRKREIEKLAYELYERDGCMPGQELEHWLNAERVVASRHIISTDGKPVKAKRTITAKKAPRKSPKSK